jgi:hypothetical protein
LSQFNCFKKSDHINLSIDFLNDFLVDFDWITDYLILNWVQINLIFKKNGSDQIFGYKIDQSLVVL